MTYRTRSARRLARKSRSKFISTIIFSALLIYITLFWILPYLINGLGTLQSFLNPSKKEAVVSENPTLAPPVLNIPYEATNSSQIDILGFATPNTKVRLYIDEKLQDEVSSSEDGSFKFYNIQLQSGTNNIFGKTLDEKNQESLSSKTIRLLFDNEKPILEVSELEDGKTVQGERKLKISGRTEVGAKVFVNDAQSIVSSDGFFNLIFNLNDGENNLNFKAIDNASNFTEVTRKITFQP